MLKCSKCDKFKDNRCFHKSNTIRRGYTTRCKKCISKINKTIYLNLPKDEKDKFKKKKLDEYYKNKKAKNEKHKEWLSKNVRKASKTMALIGCETGVLIQHLESLWKEDMSWGNYGYGQGKWVIDHIKPCCSFDLSKEEEQRECFNYKNMQPLWWKENLQKLKQDQKQKFIHENPN